MAARKAKKTTARKAKTAPVAKVASSSAAKAASSSAAKAASSSAAKAASSSKANGMPVRQKDAYLVRMFIENVALGMSPYGAAKTAGCSNPQRESKRYMEDPDIKAAIATLQEENRKNSEMTRQDVMEKLIRAVDIAEMQGDVQAMVRALSEVNRMCGFHAPEKKIHELRGSVKEVQAQLEDMTKEELLEELDKEEETPTFDTELNDDGVYEVTH